MRPLIYDDFDGEIAKDDNARSSKSNVVKSQDELTIFQTFLASTV